ncbi:hypothetical protein [Microcoleus sp. bin38.metabat.b11b12b14.051]|uniref:calcium-binding protein n=1 Tax=Microcoleus sp. bin38.metabat.b11b12b14.051 TaxID=2742709 RepID=UPI0025D0E782|nr:hypothetical protein [Microcoleus sp. bin38.metabat.b11b12b14.051]
MSNETKIWTGVGQSYLTKDNSIDVNIASSERYQLSIKESGESGDSNSGYESGYDSSYKSGDSNSGYESGYDSSYNSGDSNSGYESGYQSYNSSYSNSGYESGYQSGYEMGFSSGQPVNYSNYSPVTGNFSISSQGYESGGNFYQNEIKGTDGNDIMTGILGNNIALKGRSGNDILSGNNGNDKLEGGKGQDTLDGGAGNDILEGGKGKDILTGGMGSDLFELEWRSAGNTLELADVITDFQKGADKLNLADGLGLSNVNITQGTGIYAGDTLLQVASTGQYLAVLRGVNYASINVADFSFS